ncbi:MAG: glutathione S-transferase family protein [Alphaproteobacteria bacterium]|nr:glutathione S-transferase family protein [Alphaproteobacteria bacterium]
MQLFYSAGSPYARIARMAVLELGLEGRVAFTESTLRDPASTLLPHNPVGRVPSLVLADGTTVTETTPILLVLDSLVSPGKRLLGDGADGWKRLAAYGRVLGMLDGIAVWNRELRRPVHERSPGVIALEETRAARIAAALQDDVARGVYATPDAGFLALLAVLGYCERRHRVWQWRASLPGLATWFDRASGRASFAATMPPESGI